MIMPVVILEISSDGSLLLRGCYIYMGRYN